MGLRAFSNVNLNFNCDDPEAAASPAAESTNDRACHECGCTYFKPCIDDLRGPCWWVAADLCSACRDGWGKSDA